MNLHDELGRHGADATAESARSLGSVEVRETLGARVRRGRRVRTAGGAGVVAAVALVAVGVWSVLPGVPQSDPAGVDGSFRAGPYGYQVTQDSPRGEPEILLQGDGAVACGDDLALTPGVTVHDESAVDLSIVMAAMLGPESDLEQLLSDEEEAAFLSGSGEPAWGVSSGGSGLVFEAVAIARDGATVAGIGRSISSEHQAIGSVGEGGGLKNAAVPLPRIGECADTADARAGQPARATDTVLVGQFWKEGPDGESVVQATIVVDPNAPATDGGALSVDESTPVSEEMPVDLRRQEFLECGTSFDGAPGVTRHADAILDAGLEVSARAVLSGDDGSRIENPSSVRAGDESLSFIHDASAADAGDISLMSVPLVLHEGRVVSVGVIEEWFGPGEAQEAPVLSPGECAGVEPAGHAGDGTYEPVLVTQAWSADLQQPLATIVFSAGEIEYTGLGEATAAPNGDGGPVDGPVPFEELPAFGEEHYLAGILEERRLGVETPTCEALLSDEYVTPTGDASDVEARISVPSWIETGRLYGYGDDALVGGYPIPVDGMSDADHYDADAFSGHLVLHGLEDTWVFSAAMSYRDDLPHDDPGLFMELNQVWDCGAPDVIEPGVYDATLIMPFTGGATAVDLTPITIVSGVPSIPELDEQG